VPEGNVAARDLKIELASEENSLTLDREQRRGIRLGSPVQMGSPLL
jgi:hypothetical protein